MLFWYCINFDRFFFLFFFLRRVDNDPEVTLGGGRKKNIESRKGHSTRKSKASIPSAQKARTIFGGLRQSAGAREISGSILTGDIGQLGGTQEGGNSADSKVTIPLCSGSGIIIFARNIIQPFR